MYPTQKVSQWGNETFDSIFELDIWRNTSSHAGCQHFFGITGNTHNFSFFPGDIIYRLLTRNFHTQNGSDQTCYQIVQLMPPLLSGKPVGVGLLLAQWGARTEGGKFLQHPWDLQLPRTGCSVQCHHVECGLRKIKRNRILQGNCSCPEQNILFKIQKRGNV